MKSIFWAAGNYDSPSSITSEEIQDEFECGTLSSVRVVEMDGHSIGWTNVHPFKDAIEAWTHCNSIAEQRILEKVGFEKTVSDLALEKAIRAIELSKAEEEADPLFDQKMISPNTYSLEYGDQDLQVVIEEPKEVRSINALFKHISDKSH